MDKERNPFEFREFRKVVVVVVGWLMKSKEERHRNGGEKDQGQTCQQGPQPICTATWEDLKNMNACVPPPEILM